MYIYIHIYIYMYIYLRYLINNGFVTSSTLVTAKYKYLAEIDCYIFIYIYIYIHVWYLVNVAHGKIEKFGGNRGILSRD